MIKKKVKSKPAKKKPTTKQKKLVKGIVENLGKKGKTKPMGKIMLEAGYSKAQSKNPKQIIESKTFQQLLDAAAPDQLLTRVLTNGLKHPGKGNGAAIVRHHYLTTGLKLKKHLNPMGEEVIEAFKQMVQFQIPSHKELPK